AASPCSSCNCRSVAAMTDHQLPGIVAEIAEVAGIDAAWALVGAKGGQQVFIPAKAKPDHWLTKLVGLEAAQAICKHFSINNRGDDILIPMAVASRRHEILARALSEGVAVDKAASLAGMHRRTVFRHRKRNRNQ